MANGQMHRAWCFCEVSKRWPLIASDRNPKPKTIMIKLVHKDPAFKYSVTVTNAEGQPNNVEFKGAIDGKPYKETGTQGGTTVTYKRTNDSTIEGTATSADGTTTET